MELQSLKYFVVVATERNFTRAAKLLYTSQPNVSRRIASLEAELGTPLFLRQPGKLLLTAEGQYLLEVARRVVEMTDQATFNLREHQVAVSGKVTITSGESHALWPVARAIVALHHSHPRVQTQVVSGSAAEVFAAIENGQSDFGVVMGLPDDDHYRTLTLPEQTRYGLLLPASHPLASKTAITRDDLVDLSLIVPTQQLGVGRINAWLGPALNRVHLAGEYSLINNAVMLVEAGLGCALVLDGIVNLMGTQLAFRPFAPQLTAPMTVIWQRDRPLSMAAQLLLEGIKREVAADQNPAADQAEGQRPEKE